MPTTTIDGRPVHVDAEGFLTDLQEWSEPLASALATLIGLELTDEHLRIVRLARDDFAAQGESPTLRRMSTVAGVPIKTLFTLFPQKPAKKIAYVAGLPKPRGCI
jgi:TusE/DsrC/DsvC family sulfur relay protein